MDLLDSENWKFKRANFDGEEFDYSQKKPIGQYTHRYSLIIENKKKVDGENTLIAFMMNPSSAGTFNGESYVSDTTVNDVLDYSVGKYKNVIVINLDSYITGSSIKIKDYYATLNDENKYVLKTDGDNKETLWNKYSCINISKIKELVSQKSQEVDNFDMLIGTGNILKNVSAIKEVKKATYKEIMENMENISCKVNFFVAELRIVNPILLINDNYGGHPSPKGVKTKIESIIPVTYDNGMLKKVPSNDNGMLKKVPSNKC